MAHLLPSSPSKFDSSKQLTKADFRFFPWDTLTVICWSKAIHFVKGWSNPSPLYSPQQFMPYHCYSSCLQFNISYLDSQAFNLVEAPTSSLQVFSSSLFLPNSNEYYSSYKITSSKNYSSLPNQKGKKGRQIWQGSQTLKIMSKYFTLQQQSTFKVEGTTAAEQWMSFFVGQLAEKYERQLECLVKNALFMFFLHAVIETTMLCVNSIHF